MIEAGTEATEGLLLRSDTTAPSGGMRLSSVRRPKTWLSGVVPLGAFVWLRTNKPLPSMTSMLNDWMPGGVVNTVNERTADQADSAGSVGDRSPC